MVISITCKMVKWQAAGKTTRHLDPVVSVFEVYTLSSIAVQFSSVAWLCPTLCDPIDCSMPGLPVHHQIPEFNQTHVQ